MAVKPGRSSECVGFGYSQNESGEIGDAMVGEPCVSRFHLNPFWRMGKWAKTGDGCGEIVSDRDRIFFERIEWDSDSLKEKAVPSPSGKPLDSESGLGGGKIRSSRGRNGRRRARRGFGRLLMSDVFGFAGPL